MKVNWKKILACVLVSIMVLNSFASYASEIGLTTVENVVETASDSDAENVVIEEVIIEDEEFSEDEIIIEEEKPADDGKADEDEGIVGDATVSDADPEIFVDDEHINNGFVEVDYEPDDVLPSENTKKASSLPAEYKSPYATSVKDQRSYGTCWSFSSNGAAEASMELQGLDGKPNYSEWALAYFIFHNPSSWPNKVQELTKNDYSYLPDPYDDKWWNNGGNQLWSAMFFSAWRGVANETQAVYPFSTGDGSGEVKSDKKSPYVPGDDACNNVAAKLVDARFLPYGGSTNRDLIKQYIKNYGSIAVSYYHHKMKHVQTTDPDYWVVDSEDSQTTSNHSVLCVGWDDNKNAWLIKGSYGSTYSYSKNGYYWLPYDNPSIDDWTAMQFTCPDTYEYNYHYDGDCIFATKEIDDKSQIANIYPVLGTANTYQQIEAVNVGIHTANTKYTVEIYTSDTKMSKPTDGTKASVTASGTTDASGLYTTKFSTPVKVKVGTYFAVVVTVDFPGTANGEVFVDQTYKYTNHIYQNTTAAGESMDFVPSRGNWYDGTKYSRALTYRIKAFTNTAHSGAAHTVTFNPNGGTVELTTKTVFKDSTYGTLPIPIRDGYEFEGWFTSDGSHVTESVTYKLDTNQTLYAHWKQKHTITWKNYDGSTLRTDSVTHNTLPNYNGTPVRPSDEQYSYTFTDWSPSVVNATADATYTAQYIQVKRKYTVTFRNDNGQILQTDELEFGARITPPEKPSKAPDAQYTYTFNGWDKEVAEKVTGDEIYTATYTTTLRKYTVLWVDWNDEVLKTDQNVPFGTTPSYEGTPTRADDPWCSYEFTGWSPQIRKVSTDVTYKATYRTVPYKYNVTISCNNNSYGSVSTNKISSVEYGTYINARGNKLYIGDETIIATAAKESSGKIYKFISWTGIPNGETITGTTIIKAVFECYTESTTQQADKSSFNYNALKEKYHIDDTDEVSFTVSRDRKGTPTTNASGQVTEVIYEISPAIQIGNDEPITIENKYITSGIKIRIPIPEKTSGKYAVIKHIHSDGTSYTQTVLIQGSGLNRYAEITVDSFSTFEITFTNTDPDSGGGTGGGGTGGGGGGGGSDKPKQAAGTFSQYWKQDAAGTWRIFNKQNQMITSAWLCDNEVTANGLNIWYLIQADGTMLAAGFVQDNTGNFYSIETNHNGYFGMLRYIDGWYNCNGQQVYLQFSHAHDGTFGAVINADGRAKLQAIYGLTRFYIGNERSTYTASF